MLTTPFATFVSAEEAGTFSLGVTDYPNNTNNSFETAQTIYSDFTVTGMLKSQSESDYYKIVVPIDGKVNFWMGNIPTGCDYELEIYDSEQLGYDSSITTNDYEEILGVPANAGDIFYIRIYSFSGYSTTQSYSLRVRVYLDSYAFFAQTAPSTTTDYVANFDKTYDADYLTATDWQKDSWYTNLANYGCFVCSFAMVLKNLNKTTTRTIPNIMAANGATIPNQYMSAQPYAIMWANTTPYGVAYSLNTIGTTFTYQDNKYITAANASDMCIRDRSAIGLLFDVAIATYNVGSMSTESKKNAIANFLSKNQEGIILVFNNSTYATHAMVITETTYEGTQIDSYESSLESRLPTNSQTARALDNSNIKVKEAFDRESIRIHEANAQNRSTSTEAFSDGDMFTAYDPGRYNGTTYCNGVSLNRTYTSNYYNWDDLTQIIVIEQ